MHDKDPALRYFCIHGAPRSGTSWLGEIFNSHPGVCYKFQPLFSYALKDYLTAASSGAEIGRFFQLLATRKDAFLDRDEDRSRGRLPTFSKLQATHVGYKEVRYHQILPNLLRKCRAVRCFLIVRDPRASICSWWKSPKEFRADHGWKIEDEWRYALRKNLNRPEEYNGFERWKDAARLFLHLADANPERVTLIRYSELLRAPHEAARSLFAAADLDYPEQTAAFVASSRQLDGSADRYSVFRTRDGDDEWRSSLPAAIADEIARDLRGTPLATFLDAR